jgi:hypothetical protein
VVIDGSVPDLLEVAFRTGLFHRAGADALVAVRTLFVGCIRLGKHFGILDLVDIMAIQTDVRRWGTFFRIFEMAFATGNESGLVIAGMVMTIVAGDIIVAGVLVMLKEDVAGGTPVLDTDGLVRGVGGKSGVTY